MGASDPISSCHDILGVMEVDASGFHFKLPDDLEYEVEDGVLRTSRNQNGGKKGRLTTTDVFTAIKEAI